MRKSVGMIVGMVVLLMIPSLVSATRKYDKIIKSASDRNFGIESDFYWHKARLRVESNFNPKAVSPVGAAGISQFMPATAIEYGAKTLADRLDPVWSINSMVKYIRDIWDLFGDAPTTVDRQMLSDGGYNWGPSRVLRLTKRVGQTWSGAVSKMPRETQLYSPAIQRWRKIYRGGL